MQRIAKDAAMTLDGPVNRSALAGKAVVIDPGASTRPAGSAAAEQGCRDGSGRRRIADAHFAKADEVRICRHGFIAGCDGAKKCVLIHGGRFGEIRGRSIEVERDDAQSGPSRGGELVDGGTAAAKVCHHLRCHLGRKRRNTLGDHAMIAGEYQYLNALKPRWVSRLPPGKPSGKFLKPAEAARRLGEPDVMTRRRGGRAGIARRQIKTGGVQRREGWKAHHGGRKVFRAPEIRPFITACPANLIMSISRG